MTTQGTLLVLALAFLGLRVLLKELKIKGCLLEWLRYLSNCYMYFYFVFYPFRLIVTLKFEQYTKFNLYQIYAHYHILLVSCA